MANLLPESTLSIRVNTWNLYRSSKLKLDPVKLRLAAHRITTVFQSHLDSL
jgi:hypothetical protein